MCKAATPACYASTLATCICIFHSSPCLGTVCVTTKIDVLTQKSNQQLYNKTSGMQPVQWQTLRQTVKFSKQTGRVKVVGRNRSGTERKVSCLQAAAAAAAEPRLGVGCCGPLCTLTGIFARKRFSELPFFVPDGTALTTNVPQSGMKISAHRLTRTLIFYTASTRTRTVHAN